MDILINKIFKDKLPSVDEIYEKYTPRNLKAEQKITRIAPSPTGFVHLGTIYTALINERIAHTTNGVFFIRIEDTDTKREVDGSAEALIKAFKEFNIIPDEYINDDKKDIGNYGPYRQSLRKDIYNVFIKDLLKRGLAYICFSTEEELENIINQQKAQNCPRLGYYGAWAKYRNFPIEETIKKIDNGEDFVIRLKSQGNFNNKITINDGIKGIREFPDNDLDIVIRKKDGLPTYHFAHAIDDFLMGTNIVIRADEWFPSIPLHLQLFKTLGWKPPKYAHISPIMKMEGDTKRKLSKRKDPESNVEYFKKEGYPIAAIIEYLMNLANSNFEDWRRQNSTKDYKEFPFSISKLNTSGALFDFAKLSSVGKDVISRMSVDEIYNLSLEWAENFNANFAKLLKNKENYIKKILSIERDNPKKVRKDISKWSDLEKEIIYFFEFNIVEINEKLKQYDLENVKKIKELFLKSYNEGDNNQEWFEKIKLIAEECGYASNMKDFKEKPENYKGNISDVATILRIATTGREQSPDLCAIMQIIGKDEIIKRFK